MRFTLTHQRSTLTAAILAAGGDGEGRLPTREAKVVAQKPAGLASMDDAAARRVSAGVRAGDREALERLYRAWFDRAYALARVISRRDEAFALDAVQEAMLRAIRGLPVVGSGVALDAWMAAAVRSAVIDAVRRESRRTARERGRGSAGAETDAGMEAARREDVAGVGERVAELGTRDGELVRRRFAESKTVADAGAAAGMSTGAAQGRLRRVMAKLKRSLTEEEP